MKHFVGIDWSSQYDDINIINEKEEIVKKFRIEVSKKGFDILEENLENLKCSKEDIFIGIETDKNILAEYLITNGYNVYSINPLCVHRFKQIYSPASKKDDEYDAYSLALMLFKDKNKFRPIYKSSPEIEEMKIHIETEQLLIKQRTRLIQQLRNALSLYFPVFCEFFSRLDTSVPLNLLKCINNINDVLDLSFDKYLELIKNVKYMTYKRKEDFYNLLNEKLIYLNSPTIKPLNIRTNLLVEQIISINGQLKTVHIVANKIFDEHQLSNVFSSLPGAGETLAPKLLVHFGDNKKKFSSFQAVQCYSGTAPVTEKSGKYLCNIKMRRACKKSFRNTLQQFAFCSLKSEPWARESYDKLRSKGKGHSSAVRAIANKWVKIIFRMWQNNEEYKSEIFLEKRKKYLQLGNKQIA